MVGFKTIFFFTVAAVSVVVVVARIFVLLLVLESIFTVAEGNGLINLSVGRDFELKNIPRRDVIFKTNMFSRLICVMKSIFFSRFVYYSHHEFLLVDRMDQSNASNKIKSHSKFVLRDWDDCSMNFISENLVTNTFK